MTGIPKHLPIYYPAIGSCLALLLPILLRKGTHAELTNPCPEHTEGFGSLDKNSGYFKALLHCRDYNSEAMGRVTGVTWRAVVLTSYKAGTYFALFPDTIALLWHYDRMGKAKRQSLCPLSAASKACKVHPPFPSQHWTASVALVNSYCCHHLELWHGHSIFSIALVAILAQCL